MPPLVHDRLRSTSPRCFGLGAVGMKNRAARSVDAIGSKRRVQIAGHVTPSEILDMGPFLLSQRAQKGVNLVEYSGESGVLQMLPQTRLLQLGRCIPPSTQN